jgi:hypothetical protein
MTFSSTVTRVSTAGDGIVTAFSFPYLFFADNDLRVTLVVDSTGVETVKTITTHYTVVGAGVAAGGTVTMSSAPASGETLLISRIEQFTQGLDLVENDSFPSELVEKQFDILTMLTQQNDTQISRSVRFVESYAGAVDPRMPAPVAGAYLLWNAAADALTTSSDSSAQWLGGNGTVSLPYYSFSADPDSGIYRIGTNNIGVALNAAKVLDIATTGLTVTGTMTGSGILSIDSSVDTSSGTTGSVHTDGGLGIAKKLYVGTSATISGVLTAGGNIVSDTDSTDDLGTTGVRWANAFIDAMTVTAAVTAGGVITGLTVEATGDTSAADNAAMGYTSAEGLILTGQGSGTDVTIKNDADATVMSIPTGTTNVTFGGNIVSDTDSTDNIGTNAVRWATAYVDALTLTDNATIGGNLTVTGNLTINGTTVTNDATNVNVKDPLIEINSGATSNANDLGVLAERGSTGNNVFWGWDESSDRFVAGLTTAIGTSTGNISFSAMAEVEFGNVVATGATFSGTSSNLGTVTTVDINGGTLDGSVIGGAAAAAGTFTDLASTGDTTIGNATGDALTINPAAWTLANAVTVTGTWANLGAVTTADINGGTVDGAVIGGSTAAAISGTTLSGSTSLALATGATITGFADEDTMSSNSATLGVTQQSTKAYVDSSLKAPGIQMLWETTTTDTDQGAGKVWTNNATLSSATVLYFDDVEASGVSINALIDALDDPTATNSATVYIQEKGSGTAGVLYQVSGSVTSASTYSKVAVTHLATFGTLADGDAVGVVFAFSGNNGVGDLVAANNLSDVASAPTALSNLGGVGVGLTLALGG